MRTPANIYRMIFDNSRDAIYITSRKGRVVKANQAMLDLFGYSAREVVGLDVRTFYANPEDRMRFQKEIERRDSVKDYEVRLRKEDGTIIDSIVTSSVRRGNNGRILGYQGIIRDITRSKKTEKELRRTHEALERRIQKRTAELVKANRALQNEIAERKKIEEALRESEKDYRSMFENAVEGICRATVDGKFLKVNPAFVKMLGYDSEDEVLQIDIPTQLYYDQLDRLEFQRKIAESGKVTNLELRMKRRNGELIYVNVNDRMQKDDSGNILFYEATVEDVTERKKSELALQKAHAELEMKVRERTADLAKTNRELRAEIVERTRMENELRESESRYRTLVELSPEIILVYSGRSILYLNMAGARFFGKEDLMEAGKGEILDLFHPSSHVRARDLFRRIEAGESSLLEEKITCANERVVFIEVSSAPIQYSGELARLVVLRDVTERKIAEEQLFEYQKQLRSVASELSLVQEKERRKMATLLHDQIGQALAMSKIRLKALKESIPIQNNNESIDDVLELLEKAIRETRSLTLDLSPPILYELGFEPAVEWLVERTREEHGINAQYENDHERKPLHNDIQVLLFHALREILMNIRKHSRAHNAKISLKSSNGDVQVIVEDDGVGFDVDKIYSYYDRSAGFGLFSIREQLRHLGCKVDIRSQPGSGTRIMLEAPLADVNSEHGYGN